MIYCRSGSPGIYTPDYVMDSQFCRKIRGLGRSLVKTHFMWLIKVDEIKF